MNHRHQTEKTLNATPQRVFEALADSAQLEVWFAEHAKVEARLGGAFQFWGKATLGAPPEPDPSQKITAFEPNRVLEHGWRVLGQPSVVRYQLEPDSDASRTKLTLTHEVSGALPFRSTAHTLDDLWRMQLGNLSEHVRGRQGGVVLPDFSSREPTVRSSIEIAAAPAKVFRALLEPELMNRWLYASAKVDVAKGTYSYGWQYEVEGRQVSGGPTRIIELVENERLVTDWPDWRGEPGKPPTRVTWLLEALDGGTRTRVTVVHEGFEHAVDRSDYQQGWAGFLGKLAAVLAEV
ncbi:SRPBCC family protein [Hyalangium versicolor]|uniref:SRPBCC family protein n=1 Tax=Hyalangium versicolor TaxID=2861190 RepID=UPI001CCC2F8D|nr:SRPBCC family protein [Hyalangium versicolor]